MLLDFLFLAGRVSLTLEIVFIRLGLWSLEVHVTDDSRLEAWSDRIRYLADARSCNT